MSHNPNLDVAEKNVNVKEEKKVQGGAIDLLARVYRERGFLGWYKGLGAQIVKAVLCQGMSSPSSPSSCSHFAHFHDDMISYTVHSASCIMSHGLEQR
jgi:hypothetical protein